MRDRDAGDGGPPDVIIRDQEGAGYRGQHPDLVTGVGKVRPDGRLDLADDLERARAHDGNARTRTGLRGASSPPQITAITGSSVCFVEGEFSSGEPYLTTRSSPAARSASATPSSPAARST